MVAEDIPLPRSSTSFHAIPSYISYILTERYMICTNARERNPKWQENYFWERRGKAFLFKNRAANVGQQGWWVTVCLAAPLESIWNILTGLALEMWVLWFAASGRKSPVISMTGQAPNLFKCKTVRKKPKLTICSDFSALSLISLILPKSCWIAFWASSSA